MPDNLQLVASVAVCTRDRAHTLADCIRSVAGQELPASSFEVVIVDDGSTDETVTLGPQLAAEHDVVRCVRQEHGGLSNARNRAIRESRGELICFVDDDAVASPGWLRAYVDAAQRHAGVLCFAGRTVLKMEAKPPRTCDRESLAAELDAGTEERLVRRAKGANMAIRRSAFEKVGLFNPALVARGDEEEWQKRLNEIGGEVLYVPEALVHHRRLRTDLRIWNVLRERIRRGAGQVAYKREAGVPFSYGANGKQILFGLMHAVRRGCPGGILHSVTHAGAIWAALRGELDRPPTTPPIYREGDDSVRA